MNKKILLTAGISSVLLLAGCASGSNNQETMSNQEVMNLNSQMDQLCKEVTSLRQNQSRTEIKADEARKEAIRANKRIDNIAQSYTK